MSFAVQVLTAGALKEGAAKCAQEFEAANSIKIETSFTHGHDILAGIEAGDMAADILGLPDDMIGTLAAGGLIDGGTRKAIGAIRIAAAVKNGETAPGLNNMEEFGKALIGASEVILTTAPSGKYLDKIIENLGLGDALKGKTIRLGTGAEVNERLANKAPAGALAFGVSTEILYYRDRGVRCAGYLPAEIENVTLYEIALTPAGAINADARAFFNFLCGDAGRAHFLNAGVE
ncbi:MAG: substrate-binding domain-containing protein [Rhodospirillales bacterium]|nr:substrate-binding domain-containing protein [Rhodospirillales bacterium]